MSSTNLDDVVTTLQNGTRVAVKRTSTDTIATKFRIKAGSAAEASGEDGLAHLLEHVMVESPTKSHSVSAIRSIQERVGSFNASTSPEYTCIIAGMLSEDFDDYLNWVEEAIFHPEIDEQVLEQEKRRVLRERSDRLSHPAADKWKQYLEDIFGKDSIYTKLQREGNLGKPETVRNFASDDLERFHEREYHGGNLDILLVGDLPDHIEKLIRGQFGNKPAQERNQHDFPRNPLIEDPIVYHISAPEMQQNGHESPAVVHMDVNAPTQDEEGYYPMIIMQNLLAGGRNPLLFKEVSRKRGLAYDIGAQYNNDLNEGRLSIDANVNPNRIDEAIEGIFAVFQQLQSGAISEEKIEKIQHNLKYSEATNYQTNSGKLTKIESTLDKDVSFDDHMQHLHAVSSDDVRKVACNYLPSSTADKGYGMFIRNPLK